jgi:hypothetical protein
MIEQYQPQIDEIQASLAREDLTKREKILWVFKIGKLSEKILADFEKQVGYDLRWPRVKNQVEWLDNWERAEMRLLLDEDMQSDDSYKEAASGH